MPHISELRESKYLKKEDVGNGLWLTIVSQEIKNVAQQNDTPEEKVCLYFAEHEKPWVLNSTNGKIIGKLTGLETTEDFVAYRVMVELWNDPTISFGNQITGGIRVRQAQITVQTPQLQRSGPPQRQAAPSGSRPPMQQPPPFRGQQQPPQQQPPRRPVPQDDPDFNQ